MQDDFTIAQRNESIQVSRDDSPPPGGPLFSTAGNPFSYAVNLAFTDFILRSDFATGRFNDPTDRLNALEATW